MTGVRWRSAVVKEDEKRSKRILMALLLITGIATGSGMADARVPIGPAAVTDGHVSRRDDVG